MDPTTGAPPPMDDAAAAAGAAGGLLFCGLYIAMTVVFVIGGWKMLAKASLPGIAIIVPIWQWIAFAQLAQKPWWWGLLFLVPIVNIVIIVMILNGISTAFGRGIGTTLGLLFLSPIFVPILGFGSAEYQGQASGFD